MVSSARADRQRQPFDELLAGPAACQNAHAGLSPYTACCESTNLHVTKKPVLFGATWHVETRPGTETVTDGSHADSSFWALGSRDGFGLALPHCCQALVQGLGLGRWQGRLVGWFPLCCCQLLGCTVIWVDPLVARVCNQCLIGNLQTIGGWRNLFTTDTTPRAQDRAIFVFVFGFEKKLRDGTSLQSRRHSVAKPPCVISEAARYRAIHTACMYSTWRGRRLKCKLELQSSARP